MDKNEATEDQFITLVVSTTGEDLKQEFNVQQPMRVVFQKALKVVGGEGNADQFSLEYNDQELDLTKKIMEYIDELNWEDGTILDLVPRPEVI